MGSQLHCQCDRLVKSNAYFDMLNIIFSPFLLHRVLNKIMVCLFAKEDKCTGVWCTEMPPCIKGKLTGDNNDIVRM